MTEPASAGPFRLSIWTSLYWDLSPESALRHIADQGWGAVDLSCEHFGEIWRSEPARADAWRKLAEELGIIPHQCHLFMDLNLAAPDADERAANVALCAEHLALASRLGVRNAVFHPGWTVRGGESPPEVVRDAMIESLLRLSPVCAETGVCLAVENVMNGLGAAVESLVDLVRTADPNRLGICYDSSHGNVMGLDPGDAIRACGESLFCLHLSDNDGSGDQHRLPFEGTVDWPGLMAALSEIDYSWPVNFELPALSRRPLAVRDAALPYLRRVIGYAVTGADCCYVRRDESVRDFCRQGWLDPTFGYE